MTEDKATYDVDTARQVLAEDEQRRAEVRALVAQDCWKAIQEVLGQHKARFELGIAWRQDGTLTPTLSIEVVDDAN